jgi:uncharacterized protein YecT (DUF1311 family)
MGIAQNLAINADVDGFGAKKDGGRSPRHHQTDCGPPSPRASRREAVAAQKTQKAWIERRKNQNDSNHL